VTCHLVRGGRHKHQCCAVDAALPPGQSLVAICWWGRARGCADTRAQSLWVVACARLLWRLHGLLCASNGRSVKESRRLV